MKTLKNLFVALGAAILAGLALTCAVTLLVNQGTISGKTNDVLIICFSLALFLLVGLVFGRKQKSHGLWWGLLLGGLYAAVALTVRGSTGTMTSTNGVLIGCRALMVVFGSILGVNFGRRAAAKQA